MANSLDLFENAEMALLAVKADPFFVSGASKAKGGLAVVAPFVAALLSRSMESREEAMARALAPDVGLFVDMSGERFIKLYFDCFDFSEAKRFGQDDEIIGRIPAEFSGSVFAWGTGDGSVLLSYSNNYQLAAWSLLKGSGFEVSTETHDRMMSFWSSPSVEGVMGGREMARRVEDALGRGMPAIALSLADACTFVKGFVSNERMPDSLDSWRKSVVIKQMTNGAAVSPEDFAKAFEKITDGPKEAVRKTVQRRFDEIRKERDKAGKVYWRDTLCEFMTERGSDLAPSWDCGIAAFMLSKPSMFQQASPKLWKEVFSDVADIMRGLPEGESPDLAPVSAAASMLGQEIASGMAHFLYRFHRAGGPKSLAKKIVEDLKVRITEEMRAKTGLAAMMKKPDQGQSEESKEITKAAASVEFAVQYGAALAMAAARWGAEQEFVNPAAQAKAFVRGMKGTDEISLECLGWFARLMFHFGAGRVSKETVEKLIIAEMEAISTHAEEQKTKGGKISIENEWSGKWSSGLARRKIREYLGIPIDAVKQ